MKHPHCELNLNQSSFNGIHHYNKHHQERQFNGKLFSTLRLRSHTKKKEKDKRDKIVVGMRWRWWKHTYQMLYVHHSIVHVQIVLFKKMRHKAVLNFQYYVCIFRKKSVNIIAIQEKEEEKMNKSVIKIAVQCNIKRYHCAIDRSKIYNDMFYTSFILNFKWKNFIPSFVCNQIIFWKLVWVC